MVFVAISQIQFILQRLVFKLDREGKLLEVLDLQKQTISRLQLNTSLLPEDRDEKFESLLFVEHVHELLKLLDGEIFTLCHSESKHLVKAKEALVCFAQVLIELLFLKARDSLELADKPFFVVRESLDEVFSVVYDAFIETEVAEEMLDLVECLLRVWVLFISEYDCKSVADKFLSLIKVKRKKQEFER